MPVERMTEADIHRHAARAIEKVDSGPHGFKRCSQDEIEALVCLAVMSGQLETSPPASVSQPPRGCSEHLTTGRIMTSTYNITQPLDDQATAALGNAIAIAKANGASIMEFVDQASLIFDDIAQAEPTSSDHRPADMASPIQSLHGKPYMMDTKGGLKPVETISDRDLEQDLTTRKICSYALALSDQINRFRQHTMDDIEEYQDFLAKEYGASVGGEKGNITLTSFDGCLQVRVQIADLIQIGPEIQVARSLFFECLREWSQDSRPEIRAIITDAFSTDKLGNISLTKLAILQRVQSDDDRFKRGQEAIKDALKPISSKSYVRCYQRESYDARWEAITLDIAKADRS